MDTANAREAQTTGVLRLERHPEYADSLRGTLTTATPSTFLLSGDWEDGELILDESTDGLRIGAVWVLRIRAEDCRLRGQGHRRTAGDDASHALSMDKLQGLH